MATNKLLFTIASNERLMSRIKDRRYAMFIAVFTGMPLDLQKDRQVGLFFTTNPDRSSSTNSLTNGPPTDRDFFILAHPIENELVVETSDVYDPFQSQTLAHMTGVGFLSKIMSFDDVEYLLRQIPIPPKRLHPDFNCQHWTGLALEKLRNNFVITVDQYEKAMDGMVEGISDATEEPEPVLEAVPV